MDISFSEHIYTYIYIYIYDNLHHILMNIFMFLENKI